MLMTDDGEFWQGGYVYGVHVHLPIIITSFGPATFRTIKLLSAKQSIWVFGALVILSLIVNPIDQANLTENEAEGWLAVAYPK